MSRTHPLCLPRQPVGGRKESLNAGKARLKSLGCAPRAAPEKPEKAARCAFTQHDTQRLTGGKTRGCVGPRPRSARGFLCC